MDLRSPLVSSLIAVVLCVANTGLGYVIARRAFHAELNNFLAVVFGSLGVRMILVLVAVWYFLAIVQVDQTAFALTFVIAGFLCIMAEAFFFHYSYEKSMRQRPPVTERLRKNRRNDVRMMMFRLVTA